MASLTARTFRPFLCLWLSSGTILFRDLFFFYVSHTWHAPTVRHQTCLHNSPQTYPVSRVQHLCPSQDLSTSASALPPPEWTTGKSNSAQEDKLQTPNPCPDKQAVHISSLLSSLDPLLISLFGRVQKIHSRIHFPPCSINSPITSLFPIFGFSLVLSETIQPRSSWPFLSQVHLPHGQQP